jgi:hypothetical protein
LNSPLLRVALAESERSGEPFGRLESRNAPARVVHFELELGVSVLPEVDEAQIVTARKGGSDACGCVRVLLTVRSEGRP